MQAGIGHNKPPQSVREQLGRPHAGPFNAADMRKMSNRLIDTIINNEKLNACCRDENNLTSYFYKTNPSLPQPDFIVTVCTCNRNHYRSLLGKPL